MVVCKFSQVNWKYRFWIQKHSSVPTQHGKNSCKKKSSDHICHLNLPIGNFWRNPKPGIEQQIPGYLDVHEKSSGIRWGHQQQKSWQIFQNISVRCENETIANNTTTATAEQSAPAARDQISCQALTHRGWNSAGKQFQEANQESSWHISNKIQERLSIFLSGWFHWWRFSLESFL